MATATYDHAPAVEAIAETLIKEHHPHLQGVPIRYVYVDPPPKSKGKTVWGRARKKGPLDAHLCELEETDFFVIEASQAVWEEMTHAQRVALVDHELCHCGLTDKGKLTLLAHDLEEFTAIVQRRGLWRDSVKVFVRAGAAADRQLGLELEETPEGGLRITIGGKEYALTEEQAQIVAGVLQLEEFDRLQAKSGAILAEMDALAVAREEGLELTDYGQAEVAKLTRTCSECGGVNGPGNRQVSFPPPVEGEADRCCGCGAGAEERAKQTPWAAAYTKAIVESALEKSEPGAALATIPAPSLIDDWAALSAKAPATMLVLRHPGEDGWMFGMDATNAAEVLGREDELLYVGSSGRLPTLRVPAVALNDVLTSLQEAGCQVESHELAPAEEAQAVA